MKKAVSIITIVLLSSCSSNKIFLNPDNKWHNVYALQAKDTVILKIIQYNRGHTHKSLKDSKTEVRLIKIRPFMDYEKLPNHVTNPSIELEKTEDTGPLDISQTGSIRIITLVGGIQLIARTDKNALLKIIKQKKQKHGNN